jgi:hypothetical protein
MHSFNEEQITLLRQVHNASEGLAADGPAILSLEARYFVSFSKDLGVWQITTAGRCWLTGYDVSGMTEQERAAATPRIKTRNDGLESAAAWRDELMPSARRTERFVAWLYEMLGKTPQPQDFLLVGTETVSGWSPSLGSESVPDLARRLLASMDGDAEEFHGGHHDGRTSYFPPPPWGVRPTYFARAYDLPRGNLISEHRIELPEIVETS